MVVAHVGIREDQSLLGVDDDTRSVAVPGVDLYGRGCELIVAGAAAASAQQDDREHDRGDNRDRDTAAMNIVLRDGAAVLGATVAPLSARNEDDAAGFGVSEPGGLRTLHFDVVDPAPM